MIVVVSAIVRVLLNRDVPGPWIFIDELIYSELGRSAFDGMSIRGVPISGYGPVYPLVIGPAYAAFDNLVSAYAAVKAVNAVVMSLTAVPVYLIARTLMVRRWALAAATFAVLVPAMGYTGVVMTENAFYPAFALAMLLMIRALARPTIVAQMLVFAAAMLCFEIRPQGAVIVPAFLASCCILVVVDARCEEAGSRFGAFVRGALRFWPSLALIGAGVAGLFLLLQMRGQSFASLLGAYSTTAEARDRYQLRPIVTWFVLHIAELDLWLGVLPIVALIVLVGFALGRSADRSIRVFAAAAVPVILMMTALVSAFVVFSNVGRVEERNLFYVGFLPLVALCWWVSRGLIRQERRFVIALLACCTAPIALPYLVLISASAVSDTFGLYLPWAAQNLLQEGMLTPFAVAVGANAVGAIAYLLRPRFAPMVAIVVAVVLIISGVAVDIRTDSASAGAVSQGISGPRDWIDSAVGPDAEVAVVYPGNLEPLRVWQNEFFNRSVGPVYTLGVPMPDQLPATVVNADAQGNIRNRPGFRIEADYVLVDRSTTVVGTTVAEDPVTGMSVVRVVAPLRFSSVTSGVYTDGWTAGDAYYTRFACNGGTVSVSARLDGRLHAGPVTVTAISGSMPQTPVTVNPDGTPVTVTARLVPTGDQCQVHYVVTPTAIPAQVGLSDDARPLGVIVGPFSFSPPA
jgi:hypothetical protein